MEAWIQIVRDGGPVALLAVGAIGARWTLARIEAMQDKFLAALHLRDEALKQERAERLADTKQYAQALTEATGRLQEALDRRESRRPSSQ